jgi:hypothetical protein
MQGMIIIIEKSSEQRLTNAMIFKDPERTLTLEKFDNKMRIKDFFIMVHLKANTALIEDRSMQNVGKRDRLFMMLLQPIYSL